MASLTVAVLVCSVILLTAEAGGHGQQQEGGWQSRQGQGQGQMQGRQSGQRSGGNGARNGGGQGGWQGQDQDQGPPQQRGRQGGWGNDQQGQGAGSQQGRNGNARYVSNLYNDDDVYGYDAKYPNGEVVFVNYRNTEARSRRGPDFARSNSISARSRNGEMGGEERPMGSSRRQQRGNSMEDQHPMW